MSEALAKQMEKIIIGQIEADRLAVPSMPAIAMKCLELTRDPECSISATVDILEKDPMLSAKVLRLASSAAYSAGRTANNLRDAVMRLGLKALRSLLVEASARQVFSSKDRRIAEANAALWEHSVAVALVARDLAVLTDNKEIGDLCYMSGLLHDVGKPIVAALLLEAERMLASSGKDSWVDSDAWVGVVTRTHRRVGVTLVEKWKLPEEVIEAVRECEDFDGAERVSAPNFVRFANAVAKQEGIYVGEIDRADVDALIMVGRSLLGIDDGLLKSLTEGLADRVKGQVE